MWAGLLAVVAACASAGARQGEGTESAGEVAVAIDEFGAGNAARAGDWAGIRLAITENSDKPRNVLVRVGLEDADGDRPTYECVVTTNPGVRQAVWTYLRLPFGYRVGDLLPVQVFEAQESAATLTGYKPGRLLGSAVLAGRAIVGKEFEEIGVVGRRTMGLSLYSQRDPAQMNTWHLTGHEVSVIVDGLEPATMPDRWMGLAQFSVIVWGGGDTGAAQPGQLGLERAMALREWVERGGHLVVVLPQAGQTWTNAESNPLYDLMPSVSLERVEGIDLNVYRALLTRDREVPLPGAAVLHRFTPTEGATPGEATPILCGPDGASDCIAARRIVGLGAVTLVGMDLGQRGLAENSVPEPDMFWHRILGRRGDLISPQKLQEELSKPSGQPALPSFARQRKASDRDIKAQISKSGRAGVGVLLGFMVFALYWLIAGPIGYMVLKRTGRVRHAWVAYVAAAGAFTLIAWGGATSIKPKGIEAAHLTIIDHVYGQPFERARTWMSLLVPWYGEASVHVGDPPVSPGDRAKFRCCAAPWEPQDMGPGDIAQFPDARAYAVNAREPETIRFPVRSTVKQLQVDWAGGPRWEMPRPVAPEGTEAAAELRLLPRTSDGPMAQGMLRHNLPAELVDVVVAINRGQIPLSTNTRGGALLADVAFYQRPTWDAGEDLDLGTISVGLAAQGGDGRAYLGLLARGWRNVGFSAADMDPGDATEGKVHERLMALTFFPHLEPPDYRSVSVQGGIPAIHREATHGWDLGMWLSQPCVIVVGFLKGECPVPVQVEGRAVERWSGQTMVRWVYPLEGSPPRYPVIETSPVDGESGGEPKGPA